MPNKGIRDVREAVRLTKKNASLVDKRLKVMRKKEPSHSRNDIFNWLVETYL